MIQFQSYCMHRGMRSRQSRDNMVQTINCELPLSAESKTIGGDRLPRLAEWQDLAGPCAFCC